MSGRYKLAIAHVQVDFDVVLAPFFEVVGLKVVDDGQVVDVATALRDVTMLVAVIDLSEFANELLY